MAIGGASWGFGTSVTMGVELIGGEGKEGRTSSSRACSVAFGGASWGLGTRVTVGVGEGKKGVTLGCGAGSLAIGGASWGFVTRVTIGVVLIGGDGKEGVTSGSAAGSGATGGASSGVVIGFRTRVGTGSTGVAWWLLSVQRAASPGVGRIFWWDGGGWGPLSGADTVALGCGGGGMLLGGVSLRAGGRRGGSWGGQPSCSVEVLSASASVGRYPSVSSGFAGRFTGSVGAEKGGGGGIL